MYYRPDPSEDEYRGLTHGDVESSIQREQFKKQLKLEKQHWISSGDIEDVIKFLNQIKSDNGLFNRDIDNAVMFLRQAMNHW